MIRTLSLIKRRPDLDREAFREHYETTHAPLALPLMTGLVRYVRYHLEAELRGAIGFDVVSAFWYRDAASIAKMMESLESEAGEPLLADELTFMDKSAMQFFSVSERLLVAGDEGDVHDWLLLRKPETIDRGEASKRLVRDHLPALLGEKEAVRFALLRDAFPTEGGALPYNAVLQLGPAGAVAIDAWSGELESAGWSVAAVRTRRHETDLTAA